MKVLIVEDDSQKQNEISSYLVSLDLPESCIVFAKDMAEFISEFNKEIAICIIDLRLPAFKGGRLDNNGIGILQVLDRAGATQVKMLAISSYPEEFVDVRGQFESRGCLLLDFNQKEVWKGVLKQMVLQTKAIEVMDFLIFCALRDERAPYTAMPDLNGSPKALDNLTRLDVTISGRRGTIIEMPRMGLVDAAITAGCCIERFKPKVIATSGICAGFKGRAELGQLLVSEVAYEYQSGKWTDEGFSAEPYQATVAENVRTLVRELTEDEDLLTRLEAGLRLPRPSSMNPPKLAIFTSGSAVIASEANMQQVADLHRRVSGLDMEVYSIQRAAHIASCKPDVICAKTVVDLADGNKDDALRLYGSMISARFIVEALTAYFKD